MQRFVVCLWLFIYFIYMKTLLLPVKASKLYLNSALSENKQYGFFSVPYLLCHGTSIYNGHLRGPVALTSIAERLAAEL